MSLTAADHLELEELMHRYNHAIDAGKEDDFAAVFTEDGEWNGPGGQIRGRQELREMILSYRDHPEVKPSQHWVSAIVLTGSEVEARGRSYSLCAAPTDDGEGIEVELIGQYEDEFQKVDGRWLLRRRKVTDVFPQAVNDFDLEASA